MKIAILTLPLHTNYGGILQAYALQTVLERMGHKVELLDLYTYYGDLPLWKKPLSYAKRTIEKYLLKKNIESVFLEEERNKVLYIIRQNTQAFINQYIEYRSIDDYSKITNRGYDAVVVGSDQVWRPIYFGDNIEDAYLQFAQDWNVKRVAYAPSFGTDKWEYTEEQTKRCASLLAQFDAVSVRENSAVKLVKEKFGRDAQWVLDPTMLLAEKDYLQFFKVANTPVSKGNLMVYILDRSDEANAYIRSMERKHNYQSYRVNSPFADTIIDAPSLNDCIQPPVESWLRGFYDAEFVVTDSFHACVFSLLFNKPFVVIRNPERGNARIDSLLSMFHQEFRIIDDLNSTILTEEQLAKPNVQEEIETQKIKSLRFLEEALLKE